ncbi:hypothetical protein crov411 [Cafeteria roenbergensis virus]|uniref:Uncharacterized protein n=1 Tax=Cafeteria roenbergensis virus (strain BV-PW1) TaxID=693272 RepID=E3T5I2_CROVB|nr:hypothetical protein crov411 [Cafeteria roenbergensis virus BV-PW1]ADO67445.1 hypothetical protein crov411 [Cafeteria roenbergensis virus BV-PW1]
MTILYLLIIFILMIIFYKIQKNYINEHFTDNIFSHVFSTNYVPIKNTNTNPSLINNKEITNKPTYMPHKVSDYFYIGKLELHPYNKPVECYLYGKPIEAVHNLYSYYVFFVDNNSIIIKDSFSLNPHTKFKFGDPIYLREGPSKEGPYFLT